MLLLPAHLAPVLCLFSCHYGGTVCALSCTNDPTCALDPILYYLLKNMAPLILSSSFCIIISPLYWVVAVSIQTCNCLSQLKQTKKMVVNTTANTCSIFLLFFTAKLLLSLLSPVPHFLFSFKLNQIKLSSLLFHQNCSCQVTNDFAVYSGHFLVLI